MKREFLCCLLLLSGLFAICFSAAAADNGSQVSATAEVSALITDIDHQARKVTLKDEDGASQTITVGPEVERFSELDVGDTVRVTYTESLLIDIQPAGTPSDETTTKAARDKHTSKPGATGSARRVITAEIVNVDTDQNTITLRGPEGNEVMLNVLDPKRQAMLKKVKVGQLIRATYDQAIAISVSPAPPAAN